MLCLASNSYTDQATLNAELDTLNTAAAIKVLAVGGKTQSEQGAAAWAIGKGIPVLFLDPVLDGAGFTYANKGLGMIAMAGAFDNRMLTAGTSARITAAAGAANARGTTLTQI